MNIGKIEQLTTTGTINAVNPKDEKPETRKYNPNANKFLREDIKELQEIVERLMEVDNQQALLITKLEKKLENHERVWDRIDRDVQLFGNKVVGYGLKLKENDGIPDENMGMHDDTNGYFSDENVAKRLDDDNPFDTEGKWLKTSKGE